MIRVCDYFDLGQHLSPPTQHVQIRPFVVRRFHFPFYLFQDYHVYKHKVTRSSLTYTQGTHECPNECLLRILQDLERHQTGQVFLSFFGHMSSWMAWLRWALPFGNLGSLWKPWLPWPIYFHVLPIYYVHWCLLIFIDVHWCSFFFHSNILNQRHFSMKPYGPTGMLGSGSHGPWKKCSQQPQKMPEPGCFSG